MRRKLDILRLNIAFLFLSSEEQYLLEVSIEERISQLRQSYGQMAADRSDTTKDLAKLYDLASVIPHKNSHK